MGAYTRVLHVLQGADLSVKKMVKNSEVERHLICAISLTYKPEVGHFWSLGVPEHLDFGKAIRFTVMEEPEQSLDGDGTFDTPVWATDQGGKPIESGERMDALCQYLLTAVPGWTTGLTTAESLDRQAELKAERFRQAKAAAAAAANTPVAAAATQTATPVAVASTPATRRIPSRMVTATS